MCLTDCIVDWGDVPTWVSGVAAAGALVAAVIAAVFTFNLLRLEGTRDERARQSQAQWQADQVAVWPSSEPLGSNVMFLSEGAWIANSSPLPIYDVRIRWYYPNEIEDLDWRCNQGPLPVVPPGGQFAALPLSKRPHRRSTLGESEDLDQFRLEVLFTDAAGITWWRDPGGSLHRDETDMTDRFVERG